MFKHQSLIIVLILYACNAKRNYQVNIDKFEVSSETDPTFVDGGTMRITKRARNEFVVSGTLHLFKNIGNQGTLHFNVYNVAFSNKLIPIYSKQARFCDCLKFDKDMYPRLVKASNFPPQDQCPFPKGNYTVRDYVIDENQLPEIVPNGKFSGNSYYTLDNTLMFRYDFEFTVTPA